MALIFIVLALIWFLFTGTTSNGSSSEQACVTSTTGVDRCGPEIVDGRYVLPDAGVVIRSVVNNGPLSPEYQDGYEIDIDVSGVVTITELQGEAEPLIRTDVITTEGVQELLTDLDQCQFYYLPQRSEFEDSALPAGGSVSVLAVHLGNGDWESTLDTLSGQDLASFETCQSDLADRFGVEPPE